MRFRFISILVAVMVVFSLASTALAATNAVVNNPNPDDRLNLRTKPSADAPSLGKYYNGTEVTLLGPEENGWVKVSFGTLTGYMQAKFLATQDQTSMGTAAVPTCTINTVDGTGLTLYKTQSAQNTSLGLYPHGQTVRVFGVSETWCHVQTEDGKTGFMLRERLSPVPEFNKSSGSSGNPSNAVVNNPNPNDRLNLRTKPSANAPSLGKYYNGVDVHLLGPEENGWYKVGYGTLTGYMQAAFLETDPEKMWMVPSVTISFRVNNTSGTGLNLRESQSTKSKSLGLYKNGEIGYLLGVGETWCHVLIGNDETGFMLRESLSPVPEFNNGNPSPPSGGNAGNGWGGPVGTHPVAAWPLVIGDYTGVVNNPDPTDRLHLRAEPKEGADSWGKYYNGVRVIINGPSDGQWTKVAIGDWHGFMKTEFLAIGEPALSKVASAMPIMVVSNPGPLANLNLREGASTNTKSLGVYPNGTKAILMGFSDEWAHVIVDGKMGFMQANYLK